MLTAEMRLMIWALQSLNQDRLQEHPSMRPVSLPSAFLPLAPLPQTFPSRTAGGKLQDTSPEEETPDLGAPTGEVIYQNEC